MEASIKAYFKIDEYGSNLKKEIIEWSLKQ